MKKYISLVIAMAAIAFLSVSYLAQAQTPAAPGTAMAPVGPTAVIPAAPAPSAASITYTKDRAECDTLASAPSTEGGTPSDAGKEVIIKKCLASKGHTADEISKSEPATSVAPAAKAPATTTTPAAH